MNAKTMFDKMQPEVVSKLGTVSTPWVNDCVVSMLSPAEATEFGVGSAPALKLTNGAGNWYWVDGRGWLTEGGHQTAGDRLDQQVAMVAAEYTPDVCLVPMEEQLSVAAAKKAEGEKSRAKALEATRRNNRLVDHPR